MTYQKHPLVDGLFEEIPRHELEEMAESIKPPGGLIQKLLIYEGKLLDGWNRQAACKMAGRKLDSRDFVFFEGTPEEALAKVMALNVHRRHLSSTTRHTILMRILSAREPMAKEGRPRKDEPPKKTQTDVAKEAGVSRRTIQRHLKQEKTASHDAVSGVPTDPFGHPIPPAALPYWNRREEVTLFAKVARKLAKEINALNQDDPMWKMLPLQSLVSRAKNIENSFEASMPYCVCPTCMGKNPEDCQLCKDRGLIAKGQYERGVPNEIRRVFEGKTGSEVLM